MQVSNTVAGWRDRRRTMNGRRIGLVPTMGALHRGHASLAERCRRENDVVVVSIFVNPTQFNDPKDLAQYPRTLDDDLAMLARLGVDEIFMPDTAELYPNGYRFRVEEDGLTGMMEGVRRPGFFQGVMTVVLKLLNLVRPGRAYFGEKDYQQLQVITGMVKDFFIPVEIVPCTTLREDSGLAESSRNRLLSSEARQKAAAIYHALTASATAREAKILLQAEGFDVDYVEEHWGRRFAAASLEGVRLIDNVPLSAGSSS